LNKVSQLRGVSVLNINELANALKLLCLPGEAMRVFILKEGKEYNQGVAYLDDGTMVVVDNARRLIGKNADIAVTSVLQTTAPVKMILAVFGKKQKMVAIMNPPHKWYNPSSTRSSQCSGPCENYRHRSHHGKREANGYSHGFLFSSMNPRLFAAAGSGKRMASDRPKQFLHLAGTPIIFHTPSKSLRSATVSRK
jgi:hypothetical protein